MSALDDVAALLRKLEQLPEAAGHIHELRGAILAALGEVTNAVRVDADAARTVVFNASSARYAEAYAILRRQG